MIDKVPMVDRDTKGDIYEYMLAHRSRPVSYTHLTLPTIYSV